MEGDDGKSVFVRYPRTYEDLMQLHLVRREQPFEIVFTVELSGIEYENFLYGMDADRQFIEDHADLCSDGAVKKCLLVKQKGKRAGILVVPIPDAPAFVLLGAYYQP